MDSDPTFSSVGEENVRQHLRRRCDERALFGGRHTGSGMFIKLLKEQYPGAIVATSDKEFVAAIKSAEKNQVVIFDDVGSNIYRERTRERDGGIVGLRVPVLREEACGRKEA